MSVIGPGYGVRATEGQQMAPGYGLRAYETDPSVHETGMGPTTLPPPAVPDFTPAALADTAIQPGQSAAYLAFLRALGLDEGENIANTQRAVDSLNARAGLTQADLADQAQYAQENVAGNHEARGLFRSGARLRDESRTAAGYGRQMAGVELDTAMNVDNLVSQLAASRAAAERKRAEQAMNTTAGIYEDMG